MPERLSGRAPRDRPGNGARGAAADQGAVRCRPAALDPHRHGLLRRGDHRLLLLRYPVAEGAGRPGRRGDPQLRAQHVAVHGDHPRQVLHRVHHGDHRAAMDDHLLFRRRDSRLGADGPGASDRGLRDGRDERRSNHYRTDRAVLLHGGARLSLRAVSDRAARTRAIFRGSDRANFFRRPGAIPVGTVHRVRHDSSGRSPWW